MGGVSRRMMFECDRDNKSFELFLRLTQEVLQNYVEIKIGLKMKQND